MTQPADFTDFLAEVFQEGAWLFDQSETMDRVFEDGDFAMAQDELMDLKLLGDFIQEQATARGVDLTQFDLVKNSVALSDDKVLTPELLGTITYGVHLSQNLQRYREDNGEYIMGADGTPLIGAEGSTRIRFNGDENESAAKLVAAEMIRDNNTNPRDNNHPEQKNNINDARMAVALGM